MVCRTGEALVLARSAAIRFTSLKHLIAVSPCRFQLPLAFLSLRAPFPAARGEALGLASAVRNTRPLGGNLFCSLMYFSAFSLMPLCL